MDGYFKSVGSLSGLERVLAAEQMEITLWQNGRRMAFFLGKLEDVMHSDIPKLSCEHNINVQLLMKATPVFPVVKNKTCLLRNFICTTVSSRELLHLRWS